MRAAGLGGLAIIGCETLLLLAMALAFAHLALGGG